MKTEELKIEIDKHINRLIDMKSHCQCSEHIDYIINEYMKMEEDVETIEEGLLPQSVCEYLLYEIKITLF